MNDKWRLFPKKTPQEVDQDPAYKAVLKELRPLRLAITGEGSKHKGSDVWAKAAAFDEIVAARKAYIDAVNAYNARLEFVHQERLRGNWLNVDIEYKAMSDAQRALTHCVQRLTDAELKGE